MKDEGILSFVDRLASNDPTPGGGAAAGFAGSMGTAAILMAIRFSTNSKKISQEDVEKLNQAIEKLEKSKEKFVQLVEKDEEGFQPLSNAYKLPSETEEEKAYKQEEVEKGLVTANEAPTELIYEAENVVTIVEELVPLIKRSIVSDVGVGVQLVRSALNASKLNVYTNADMMKDPKMKAKHLEVADNLTTSLNEKIDDIFKQVQGKIRK